MSCLIKELGVPAGTLPHKRKLMLPTRGTDMLPNWTAEQAADWWLKRSKFERDDWYPQNQFAKNQGQVGSCNYYAMVMCIERLIRRYYGYYIKLSPELGYAHNVNGRDHGSLLRESKRDFAKIGAPPFLKRHWQKYHRSNFTPEDFANALRFTGIETIRILNWDMLVTAVALGYPCVVAVHVGRGFMNMDRDGFSGVDRGNGNHAIIVDMLKIARSGRIGLYNPESWGRALFDDGVTGIHEEHLEQTWQYHEAWCATTVKLDPQVEQEFKLVL